MADQQFPEPTVGVFIFNQKGEVLLLQSHKWPGAFVVPGGHVELGERIEQAAKTDNTDVVLNDEAQEYIWIEPAEALKLRLDNYTRFSIETYLKKTGQS